ncbi:MAG: Mur ligase family protein, partial [Proteobacteria bacterium]|nr:Mur ligase family protein [Pseudomonadota bacterium]
GIAASRLAVRLGYQVYVWDDFKVKEDVPSDLQNCPQIVFLAAESGTLSHQTLTKLSCLDAYLVASPGIVEEGATYQALLNACHHKQLSEVDLALPHINKPVLAITGTNGKSSMCAMIRHGFLQLGIDLKIMGNYGYPVSQVACDELQQGLDNKKKDVSCGYIMEISSFQLAHSYLLTSPVCVITNLSPSHLNRHHSPEQYYRVKWRIIESENRTASWSSGFPVLITTPAVLEIQKEFDLFLGDYQPKTVCEDQSVLIAKKMAFLAVKYFAQYLFQVKGQDLRAYESISSQIDASAYLELFKDFVGLPHRCERVPTQLPDVMVINDSKATNWAATIFALKEFVGVKTLLILGGIPCASSRLDVSSFDCVSYVVIFGRHRNQILSQIITAKNHTVVLIATLDELTGVGGGYITDYLRVNHIKCILFSPGGESYDAYRSFIDRGNHFKRVIASLS